MPRMTLRGILIQRNEEITKAVKDQQERMGQSELEVLKEDPFLAGQAYMLSLIASDWFLASQE